MTLISKRFRIVALSVALGALNGCAVAIAPVTGFVYSDVKGPITATDNADFNANKVGRSTAKSILGIYATGDASIHTAAKNGGITKIHHIDYESRSVLGVIAEVTVVVYGE